MKPQDTSEMIEPYKRVQTLDEGGILSSEGSSLCYSANSAGRYFAINAS